MQKSTEKNNQNNFLKEGIQDGISKHHAEYLGTTIPEGYFSTSKRSILDKIKEETKQDGIAEKQQAKKQLVFYMQPQFKYIAVASLVFVLSITIWLQNINNQSDVTTNIIESVAYQNDVLIESLLVADEDVDAFADATLFNEVVVKAELKEQKLDNLILDSLILEDSLLDDYMDKKLIETIIL
ncbi:hypothetical protein [Polaribacter sp. M15]